MPICFFSKCLIDVTEAPMSNQRETQIKMILQLILKMHQILIQKATIAARVYCGQEGMRMPVVSEGDALEVLEAAEQVFDGVVLFRAGNANRQVGLRAGPKLSVADL